VYVVKAELGVDEDDEDLRQAEVAVAIAELQDKVDQQLSRAVFEGFEALVYLPQGQAYVIENGIESSGID
jgi:hypothetical protein